MTLYPWQRPAYINNLGIKYTMTQISIGAGLCVLPCVQFLTDKFCYLHDLPGRSLYVHNNTS